MLVSSVLNDKLASASLSPAAAGVSSPLFDLISLFFPLLVSYNSSRCKDPIDAAVSLTYYPAGSAADDFLLHASAYILVPVCGRAQLQLFISISFLKSGFYSSFSDAGKW